MSGLTRQAPSVQPYDAGHDPSRMPRGQVPARLTPVQVAFDTPASRSLGRRIADSCTGRPRRGRRPALEPWVLGWLATYQSPGAEDPCEWRLMVGYDQPWVEFGTRRRWMILLPVCDTREQLALATRHLLAGGLTLERFLAACDPDVQSVPPRSVGFDEWVAAGAPIVLQCPADSTAALSVLQVLDGLPDEARRVGFALAAGGWSGTPAQLGDAVRAIVAGEP